MPNAVQWTRYQGHYYQILESTDTHVRILHCCATGEGFINVAPNGPPLMIPGCLWALKSQCHFFPQERIEPLPPIPFDGGLQVGSRVRWKTSMGEWSVLELSDDKAKIRQVSGWAQSVVFDSLVSELVLLDTRPVSVLAA